MARTGDVSRIQSIATIHPGTAPSSPAVVKVFCKGGLYSAVLEWAYLNAVILPREFSVSSL